MPLIVQWKKSEQNERLCSDDFVHEFQMHVWKTGLRAGNSLRWNRGTLKNLPSSSDFLLVLLIEYYSNGYKNPLSLMFEKADIKGKKRWDCQSGWVSIRKRRCLLGK